MVGSPLLVATPIMDKDPEYFCVRKEKAERIFFAQKSIYCPYFGVHIMLNSDGFHHLQFSNRRERDKNEQLLKFRLLPRALEIIRKSGTIQEYRKLLMPVGKPSARDGSVAMKLVEYWGMVAIVGDNGVKVRTIVRKIGEGNIIFWSVMPDSKIRRGKQNVFTAGIEDE